MIWYYINFLISTDISNFGLYKNCKEQISPLDLSLKKHEEVQNKRIKLLQPNTDNLSIKFIDIEIHSIISSLDQLCNRLQSKGNERLMDEETPYSSFIADKWFQFLQFALKYLREHNIKLELNSQAIEFGKRFRCKFSRYNTTGRKKFIICYENLKKLISISHDLKYDHNDQLAFYAAQIYYLYPIGTLKGQLTLTNEEFVLRMLFLETIITKLHKSIWNLKLQDFSNLIYNDSICEEYKIVLNNFFCNIDMLKDTGILILKGLNEIGSINKNENQIPSEIYKYLSEINLFN